MAAKYPGISPFVFVCNNPLVSFDPDGNVVQAKTKEAQMIILKSLSPEEAKYVEFDKNGILNASKLSQAMNDKVLTGDNYKALLFIANHKSVVELALENNPTIKDGNGKDKAIKMAYVEDSHYDDNGQEVTTPIKVIQGVVGISLQPLGWDQNTEFDKKQRAALSPEKRSFSSNGNFQVFISKAVFEFSQKSAVGTVGHEMLGHIYFMLLGNAVKGGLHGEVRTAGAEGANEDNFNKALEEWIKKRTSKAKNNYDKHESTSKSDN